MPQNIHTSINKLAKLAESAKWKQCVSFSEKIINKYDLLKKRDKYALYCFNTYLKSLWEIGEYEKGAKFADNITEEDASKNPYICHNAACLYVAVRELDKAMQQIKFACRYYYEHIDKLFKDEDLKPLFQRKDFIKLKKDNKHLLDSDQFPSYKELLQMKNGGKALEILFRMAQKDYIKLFKEMVEQEREEQTQKKRLGAKKQKELYIIPLLKKQQSIKT
jgi:predicted CopG family antitoxin